MLDPERRRFAAIVFDWDGTLADSTAAIATSIQAACRDLGQPIPDEARARYVIGLGLHGAVRHVAPALPASEYALLAAAYRRHYMALEPGIGLYEGVIELLTELTAGGYRLGIATGKSRAGLDRALAHTGLARYFEATRCADEDLPKPHPAMLQSVMAGLGVPAERTLMVGDTTHDLDLARNAGAAAVAVTYGAHDAASLDARQPLRIFDSAFELLAWLRRAG
jgi:phosphoglycolate phosphatase